MKNKLRKMLSLVLAVVIAMSAISLNTFAATIMNIVNGSNQKLYVDWYSYSYNFNGRLNTSTYGQIIKLNVGSSTGQVAVIITQAFRIRRLKKEIIKRDTADEFSRQWYWIEDKNNKQRQPLKKRKSLLSFLRSFL